MRSFMLLCATAGALACCTAHAENSNSFDEKFYRNIGQKYELLVHEIKMDFSQVR